MKKIGGRKRRTMRGGQKAVIVGGRKRRTMRGAQAAADPPPARPPVGGRKRRTMRGGQICEYE